MTRSELIRRIARKQPHLVERDVKLAVNMLFDQMATSLASGERIEIRGFGSFSLRFRHVLLGRDTRANTPISLPARHATCFKPGKQLRERINREDHAPPDSRRSTD